MVRKIIKELFFLVISLPIIMLFIIAMVAEYLTGDTNEKE